jgi:hypothetical protein
MNSIKTYYFHFIALSSENPDVMKMERDTEEKVYQIWTVLSAFEESSAATISDMLLHVSIGKYIDGVSMAKRFIDHVHILFQAIDLLDGMYVEKNEQGKNWRNLICRSMVYHTMILTAGLYNRATI